jgi:hypothetical protein
MFTTFLLSTAAAVSVLCGALLLRKRNDAPTQRIPAGALGVAVATVALVVLGLWLA